MLWAAAAVLPLRASQPDQPTVDRTLEGARTSSVQTASLQYFCVISKGCNF